MAQYKGPASESQRVMHLQKKREREQEEIEIKKRKLADDLKVGYFLCCCHLTEKLCFFFTLLSFDGKSLVFF